MAAPKRKPASRRQPKRRGRPHPRGRGAVLQRYRRRAAGRRGQGARRGQGRLGHHHGAGLAGNRAGHRHRGRCRREAEEALRRRGRARLRDPGETFHFDIVVDAIRARADRLSVALRLPIGNGILTVDTERAGLGARAHHRAGQGRRCRARGAGADRDQAPARQAKNIMARAAHRPRDARPTAGARRGSPPCRRSIRWTSRRRRLTTRWPSSRATGSAARSKATQYLPAEAAFFRDLVARRASTSSARSIR